MKGVKDSKLAKREARDAKNRWEADASFMSTDLKTVRIPRIEGDFECWLILKACVESAALPVGGATPDEKTAEKHRDETHYSTLDN